MLKPPRLQRGDTIGIIAPAYVTEPEKMELCVNTLRSLGFGVKQSEHLFSRKNSYAGSVEERAEDFNAMIADDSAKLMLFGGGEVCNEILPYIDYDNIAAHPKLICSYSDSTTILNAVHYMTGLVTFYGASPRTFFSLTDYNRESFERRMMTGDLKYDSSSGWRTICPGRCEGVLAGGYLINFSAMLGLDQYKRVPEDDYILFIEDHEQFSNPAVVSKWFSNMEQRGAFNRARGLIFGYYSDKYEPVIDDILRRLGERYRIPVAACEDFGHGVNNAIIPIGVRARLDAGEGSFEFLENSLE